MNYPLWSVPFGGGLFIAIVSVVHVFVSHFAIGGGLFLVLTEHRAYKEKNNALLEWLKSHTRFFVLVTVVFGAVTGVGIWFTIGLVQPTATSSLIHAFVWAWAIEWVFFFIEITAALLYLYGWNKVDRQLHLWYGWIYFISAFLSLVVINGMVSFMLTPGDWLQTHNFWDGFFNPTYFPSLVTRFFFSLALAGIYALLTASRIKDNLLKKQVVKWSAQWILFPFLALVASVLWYKSSIPVEIFDNARGAITAATHYLNLLVLFAGITFLLALILRFFPSRHSLVLALTITLTAFVTMWAFEYVREAIRKPYVIYGYIYSNSIYKAAQKNDGGFNLPNLQQRGILSTAHWTQIHTIPKNDSLQAGSEIFRLQCSSCHTVDSYRGVKRYLQKRPWNTREIFEMLKGIEYIHNGVMPPFAGNQEERKALALFLGSLSSRNLPEPTTGAEIFNNYCAVCHDRKTQNALFETFSDLSDEEAREVLFNLPDLMEQMPNLNLSEKQANALIQWLKNQYKEAK